MTYLPVARPSLSFGDVCSAESLTDAYLRADAAPLRERTVEGGAWMRREFQTDKLTSYIPVEPSVPALAYQPEKNFVLAHGAPIDRAACLSDDCEIETRLGRIGADPSGRLLFAPVTRLKPEELEELTEQNWGRMKLGDDAVVEIRRVFSISAEDLAGDNWLRRASLQEDWQLRLATWWAAYACRRGPLVSAQNLGKLSRAISAHDIDEADATAVISALNKAAAAAWRLEGAGVERAGEVHDQFKQNLRDADLRRVALEIRDDLAQLSTAVSEAQTAIEELL